MSRNFIAVAGAFLLATASGPAEAETLKIWIRAFIPNQHPTNPGYIRPLPGHPGRTMIPGPNIPFVTNDPVPWIGSCYSTNDRGFGAHPPVVTAPVKDAKVASAMSIGIQANQLGPVTSELAIMGVTERYACETAELECIETASAEDTSLSAPAMVGDRIRFTASASAKNRCTMLPFLTPGIKWDGSFLVSPREGTVRFTGTIAQFPAYEAYVSLNGGPAVPIFQEGPEPGSTAWSLLFNRSIDKVAHYRPIDGAWESQDTARRFRIEISGNSAAFIEKKAGGATLRREVPVASIPGASGFRIYRSNTDQGVLNFLDFAPDIQAEMLRRNPQPSYVDLFFVDGELRGTWNGILVIKNNQGKFQEMRQPGTNPPKAFTFTKG
jgi:hypothetical protein